MADTVTGVWMMPWGEARRPVNDGAGTTGQIEDAFAALAAVGLFGKPLALLAIEAAGVIDRMRPRAAIDAAHLERQRRWSTNTFGPGDRLHGILDHIRKELLEVEADPTDLGEWVDVLILAFDGAWRAGWEPQQIIDAVKAKQARNEARTWPDWRTMSADRAIEHDRSVGG